MAVNLTHVTLGSGATRVASSSVPARQVIIQNNAAHNCLVGDSTVSATRGIVLSAGSPGGSFEAGSLLAYNVNLQDFYLYGTQNDVIDVLYVD